MDGQNRPRAAGGFGGLRALSLFVHKHLNLDKKKDGTERVYFMGKFAEADAVVSRISICRKCKARNKNTARKCRKCGSVYMRPKRKDIRVKK